MKTEKPFIKLLKSPNSGYFFDVNRNEIIAVSDEAYEFLEKEQQGTDCNATAEVSAELEALRENGYLSGNKVKEIRHPLTDYSEIMLERNVSKITLQLTQECNFRCTYCSYTQQTGVQRSHGKKKMTVELAKKGIDFLRDHSIDCDSVCVGFYGGEPLLEFPLIKEIVAYCDETLFGKEILYTITTNASLITDDMVDFFEKYNIMVLLSLDGIKEINDKNRIFAANGRGTYNTVIKNLRHIYETNPKFFKKMSINTVIDPSNDFDIINALYSSEKMFENFNFQSTVIDDTMSKEKNVFSKEYTTKYTYHMFLAYLAEMGEIPFDDVSPICKNTVLRLKDDIDKMFPSVSLQVVAAPGGPCFPSENKLLLNVDGDLIPCERVSETSDCMIIGNIDRGFDIKKVKELLNVGALTSEECKNCFVFSKCFLCGKSADDEGKLSGEIKLKACDNCKSAVTYKFAEIIMLKEIHELYQKAERVLI